MPDLGNAHFFDPTGLKNESNELSPKNLCFGNIFNCKTSSISNYFMSVPVKSHFLTIAQNRSGKSVSLLVPNLIAYGGSAVVVDVKGELSWLTSRFRAEHLGQRVFVLDPWKEVKAQYGDNARREGIDWPEPPTATFNPLSLLNPESDQYSDDLAYIADALIINQSSSQPFFDDSARELVAGLIAFLVEYAPKEANFNTLRQLICMPLGAIKARAMEAQKLGPYSLAKRKLGMFADEGADKELSSILSTAKQQTAFLDNPALCEAMEGGEDVFSALLSEEGATIYLVLPVDKLQTFGRWLRLMISFAIRAVARYAGKLNQQVMMFLDEFGTIGKLSAVSTAYGLMAGRNLSIWAFVQDLNQLKKNYPQEWETFIANSQAISVFGVTDQTTAEYFSKMAGTETVEQISQLTADERKKNPSYRSMNDKTFTRPLLMPEEVRSFTASSGRGGLLFGSGDPVIYKRIKYYEMACFRDNVAPNPLVPEDVQRYRKSREEKRVALSIEALKKRYPNLESFVQEAEGNGFSLKKRLLGRGFVLKGPKGKTVFSGSEEEIYNELLAAKSREYAAEVEKGMKGVEGIQSSKADEEEKAQAEATAKKAADLKVGRAVAQRQAEEKHREEELQREEWEKQWTPEEADELKRTFGPLARAVVKRKSS